MHCSTASFCKPLCTVLCHWRASIHYTDQSLCIFWHLHVYRWETKSTALPLTLELVNATTGAPIARLKGAASTPWSKERYTLTVVAGQCGPTWLQIVAASAIAEAQRVNGKYSSSGAADTLMSM